MGAGQNQNSWLRIAIGVGKANPTVSKTGLTIDDNACEKTHTCEVKTDERPIIRATMDQFQSNWEKRSLSRAGLVRGRRL